MSTNKDYVICPHCGARTEEIVTLQISRPTHWEPAEYQDYCGACVPVRYRENPDPDEDWRRDR
jgi:hypothetical protein